MQRIAEGIYPVEDAMYYLNAVKKLPTTFHEQNDITWASIHHENFSAKMKNTAKWTELGKILIENNLIIIDKRRGAIRTFL